MIATSRCVDVATQIGAPSVAITDRTSQCASTRWPRLPRYRDAAHDGRFQVMQFPASWKLWIAGLCCCWQKREVWSPPGLKHNCVVVRRAFAVVKMLPLSLCSARNTSRNASKLPRSPQLLCLIRREPVWIASVPERLQSSEFANRHFACG